MERVFWGVRNPPVIGDEGPAPVLAHHDLVRIFTSGGAGHNLEGRWIQNGQRFVLFSRASSAGDGVWEIANDVREQIAKRCIAADIQSLFDVMFHSFAREKPSRGLVSDAELGLAGYVRDQHVQSVLRLVVGRLERRRVVG